MNKKFLIYEWSDWPNRRCYHSDKLGKEDWKPRENAYRFNKVEADINFYWWKHNFDIFHRRMGIEEVND